MTLCKAWQWSPGAADLRPATDLHRLLQALMGWPEPPTPITAC